MVYNASGRQRILQLYQKSNQFVFQFLVFFQF